MPLAQSLGILRRSSMLLLTEGARLISRSSSARLPQRSIMLRRSSCSSAPLMAAGLFRNELRSFTKLGMSPGNSFAGTAPPCLFTLISAPCRHSVAILECHHGPLANSCPTVKRDGCDRNQQQNVKAPDDRRQSAHGDNPPGQATPAHHAPPTRPEWSYPRDNKMRRNAFGRSYQVAAAAECQRQV